MIIRLLLASCSYVTIVCVDGFVFFAGLLLLVMKMSYKPEQLKSGIKLHSNSWIMAKNQIPVAVCVPLNISFSSLFSLLFNYCFNITLIALKSNSYQFCGGWREWEAIKVKMKSFFHLEWNAACTRNETNLMQKKIFWSVDILNSHDDWLKLLSTDFYGFLVTGCDEVPFRSISACFSHAFGTVRDASHLFFLRFVMLTLLCVLIGARKA